MIEPKTDYAEDKFYWIQGSVLNELGQAIKERTPLPQLPLTGEETEKGYEIKFGGGGIGTEYHVVINGTLYTHVFVTVGDPVEVE